MDRKVSRPSGSAAPQERTEGGGEEGLEGQCRAVKEGREGTKLVKQKAIKKGRAERRLKRLKRWWSLVGLATAGAGCWRGLFPPSERGLRGCPTISRGSKIRTEPGTAKPASTVHAASLPP